MHSMNARRGYEELKALRRGGTKMLAIDTRGFLAYTASDVEGMDATRVSDIAAFRRFASGLTVTPDILLEDGWAVPSERTQKSIFDLMLLEMLPRFYSAQHINSIGGSFALTITGIASYTILSVNRRVVVLSGLPVDRTSGVEVVDLEIAPEVFLAYSRGVLLEIAEDLLDDDDENEDRIVSDAELILSGIPAGGQGRGQGRGAAKQVVTSYSRPQSACGVAASTCHIVNSVRGTGVGASVCGARTNAGVCGVATGLCGANTSVSACASNHQISGANVTASMCGSNQGVCGARLAAISCGKNTAVCGTVAHAGHCGTKGTLCGAAASIASCPVNYKICGAKVGPEMCAMNTLVCAANAGGLCAVNMPIGDPFSACVVNVIPLLPSC